jgi:hypothetical protein
MSTLDAAAEARRASATAGGYTRRAERDARLAASLYASAAGMREHARWLTARPRAWDVAGTPAMAEATAASRSRLADAMLRSSFHATQSAAFYRDLGARYRAMAA